MKKITKTVKFFLIRDILDWVAASCIAGILIYVLYVLLSNLLVYLEVPTFYITCMFWLFIITYICVVIKFLLDILRDYSHLF